MKINCQIIEDLLPLYIDDVCSKESKAMIEEHLSSCESCKAKLEAYKSGPVISNDVIMSNSKAKKPFKKIRRMWIITLVCIVIGIPILKLCVNEFRGEQIGFSALYGRILTERYLAAVEEADFEKAADYMKFWGKGKLGSLLSEQQERKKWISDMNKLKSEGIEIVSHRKNGIVSDDRFNSGNIIISVRYNNHVYEFDLWVATNTGKIETRGINYINSITKNKSKIEDFLIEKMSEIMNNYNPG